MKLPFHPSQWLEKSISEIAIGIEEFNDSFVPSVRPADSRFGDFQANGVLPFAKKAKTNPRQLATLLSDAMEKSGRFNPDQIKWEIAGPGFLNFKLSADFYTTWLQDYKTQDDLKAGAKEKLQGKKIIVDFSSPNTAKEMHVGHIRSTVIGEAISRLLEFCGASTIRDNHIGDWGTQFGMLIWAIKKNKFDVDNPPTDAIVKLEQLYKAGHSAYKENEETANSVRTELVKLQNGDTENTHIWNRITEISWEAFSTLYDQLGVRFDEVLGESYYRDKVDQIYKEFLEEKLCEESEGALVVFHPEHPRFKEQPFIIRKTDGASNYATTDLATILYREENWKPDEVLYIVDFRQGDHFEQLFLTTEKWFKKTGRKTPILNHISFGTILNEDGKPIKTKEGGSVKLRELLDEAKSRAFKLVTEKNPALSEEERKLIGDTIGVESIRYADLSQNRTSDYIFSWGKMLSLDGNTAPYLLYAVARIHSIFRKVNLKSGEGEADALPLSDLEELTLASKLIGFPATLDLALSDYRPHHLSNYLYELAGAFSSFYNAKKVIVDEPKVQAKRLMLCARTLNIMETGLNILGVKTLKRM